MKITIYTAACCGNANNCLYPNRMIINDTDSMRAAVAHDHVCAEYRNSYRSVQNFVRADCLPMDCDNSESDNPEDWIKPMDVAEAFPDVGMIIVCSRSDMRQKGNKSPRPRFHVYFACSEITDAEAYRDLKARVQNAFPHFDDAAMDSARFLFGVPYAGILFYDRQGKIDEVFAADLFAEWDDAQSQIPEGSRNSTMSRYAGRIIKRLGNTDEAHERFLQEAERCVPPLEDGELERIWASAVKFGKKISAEKGYVPPEQVNPVHDMKPEDYTDISQAKVLAREYANVLTFTEASDFMRYDGIRWEESKELGVGAYEEFLDLQLAVAEKELNRTTELLVSCGVDQDLISVGGKALEKSVTGKGVQAYKAYEAAMAFHKFVLKQRNMNCISATLKAVKPMIRRDINEFDSAPFLLNTPEATYDLRLGIKGAREHRPEDLITKATLVSPGTAGADLWKDALNEFFCSDADLIEYVQQITGLAAIGKVFVEALIIAYGGGNNGKSTFWNTVSHVMGSYSGSFSADALTNSYRNNTKAEIAELKGRRLVIASELEEGVRLSTSIVKRLCATDEVGGEKKYEAPFKFIPSHTIVLYTNHLPKVGARDKGTWRRLIVIPFRATIEGKKDIKNYADYLVEQAGGAVLAWIIEGAKKAIDADYKLEQPQCVREAIGQFQESNDWLAHFLDECCEVDPSYTQRSGELYQEYRNYCTRTGEYTRSTTDFYRALDEEGFTRKRTSSGNIIRGLRLASDFMD